MIALMAVGAGAAQAQDAMGILQQYRPPPKGTSDTYIVTLGGNAVLQPTFPGSDKASVNFFPSLSYRRSDEAPRFTAPDDGIAISVIDDPSFRVGPVFRLDGGRYLADDRSLYGLRKLNLDVESGLFVEYWPLTFLRARVELRHGFQEKTGFAGNAGVDVVQPIGAFTLSVGPRVAFGDANYLNRFFGVNAAEAGINRLVYAYRPSGGISSAGLLGTVTYRWNDTWATTGYVAYNRLLSEAGNSPIVTRIGSRDQVTVGARLSYSFSYKP